MPNTHYHFNEVTLLITHYNRSNSLERLLNSFNRLGCNFGEIIVSDDGSKPEHIEKIQEFQQKHAFKLITTQKNKGLGNNINKGQDAVSTPYTLYIQEDFVPKDGFAVHFKNALDIMNGDTTIDTIRFYAYFNYPYTKPYGKGFSEMVFKKALWFSNHLKFYYYSDHPHLRRSDFLEKFGRYPEGVNVDQSEFGMALSYLKKEGRGLLFDAFNSIIDQANSIAEPSTATRRSWGESKKTAMLALRAVYLKFRLVKNTLQLAFLK